ncbi:UDP-N-acetylglucosamine 1-carboxyvinyltransferase [Candidatus Peregrinibacteria bacterium]|nr:UDP-N-acetylglucosamine 1-carboxyvinyltransferase [Candidatus Peregrinibacteria bacterium]
MANFIINGGTPLKGEIKISGSKNAALPIMCAALLTKGKTILENVPDIEDIHSMSKIIESIVEKVTFKNKTLTIDAKEKKQKKIQGNLVKKMRASILIVGALLPRFGEIKMAYPGGCVLGKRSVHAHRYAFEKLGCKILDDEEGLHIRVKSLKGTSVVLPELSVTATENAVMASVLANGDTEIRLAATEPHVQDLCHFLNKMGTKISGIGTNILKIKGVKNLKGVKYRVTGDYLEAGTFVVAAVATKGNVVVKGFDPAHLDSFWQKLDEIGVKFKLGKDYAEISPTEKWNAVRILRTRLMVSAKYLKHYLKDV